jgi:hypothetical protein
MSRQSSHVPGPQLVNSVTTVKCAFAARSGTERRRRRPRAAPVRQLTRRSVRQSQSKTSRPGIDRQRPRPRAPDSQLPRGRLSVHSRAPIHAPASRHAASASQPNAPHKNDKQTCLLGWGVWTIKFCRAIPTSNRSRRNDQEKIINKLGHS